MCRYTVWHLSKVAVLSVLWSLTVIIYYMVCVFRLTFQNIKQIPVKGGHFR